MMDTPICDFVARYNAGAPLRMHMPGHKGRYILGMEHLDITEIEGADSLFHASEIIHESEQNAGKLFGCHTFYSTEGSSLCIRAMLYLCMLQARSLGRKPVIAAPRNVHTAFVSAAALLDFDIQWLYPEQPSSYLSYIVTPQQIQQYLAQASQLPTAVYLTSPDYLGAMADIEAIAQICHQYGVLLAVDNAHGAYLKFLPQSLHPMDLGADICCDSAHKTLPVLTGGAYLHISTEAPAHFLTQAKQAMALFASTSPSYLILQSLDRANPYLAEEFPQALVSFLPQITQTRKRLESYGYIFQGDEPMKLTIDCKSYGYTGTEMAHYLQAQGIHVEFSDPDYLVLMPTPAIGASGLAQLEKALCFLPRRPQLEQAPPIPGRGERVLSPRDATLSCFETIPTAKCRGRVLARASVGCPPAVPIVICGERIDEDALSCFSYYGIEYCDVIV